MKKVILALLVAFAVVGCEAPQTDECNKLAQEYYQILQQDKELAKQIEGIDLSDTFSFLDKEGKEKGNKLLSLLKKSNILLKQEISLIKKGKTKNCDFYKSPIFDYTDKYITMDEVISINKDVISSYEVIIKQLEEGKKAAKEEEERRNKCRTISRCKSNVMREVRRTGSEIVGIISTGEGSWRVAVFKNSNWGVKQMVIDVQTDCDCNITYSNARMAR